MFVEVEVKITKTVQVEISDNLTPSQASEKAVTIVEEELYSPLYWDFEVRALDLSSEKFINSEVIR
tara:strand:- start:51634 stop:51831 length:198 start_codon:yes stop_codon:yes gene_type:complete